MFKVHFEKKHFFIFCPSSDTRILDCVKAITEQFTAKLDLQNNNWINEVLTDKTEKSLSLQIFLIVNYCD